MYSFISWIYSSNNVNLKVKCWTPMWFLYTDFLNRFSCADMLWVFWMLKFQAMPFSFLYFKCSCLNDLFSILFLFPASSTFCRSKKAWKQFSWCMCCYGALWDKILQALDWFQLTTFWKLLFGISIWKGSWAISDNLKEDWWLPY